MSPSACRGILYTLSYLFWGKKTGQGRISVYLTCLSQLGFSARLMGSIRMEDASLGSVSEDSGDYDDYDLEEQDSGDEEGSEDHEQTPLHTRRGDNDASTSFSAGYSIVNTPAIKKLQVRLCGLLIPRNKCFPLCFIPTTTHPHPHSNTPPPCPCHCGPCQPTPRSVETSQAS